MKSRTKTQNVIVLSLIKEFMINAVKLIAVIIVWLSIHGQSIELKNQVNGDTMLYLKIAFL